MIHSYISIVYEISGENGTYEDDTGEYFHIRFFVLEIEMRIGEEGHRLRYIFSYFSKLLDINTYLHYTRIL